MRRSVGIGAWVFLAFFVFNARILADSGQLVMGVYGSFLKPTGGLSQWYALSPAVLGTLAYELPGKRVKMETELYYLSFTDASLNKRTFRWAITGENIQSPDAKAEMSMMGMKVNGVLNFRRNASSTVHPYVVGGIGFHRHNHSFSGLIWPGQLENPPTVLMVPQEISGNNRVVFAGGGVKVPVSERIEVDFRVQWGTLSSAVFRSLNAWSLETVAGGVDFQASKRVVVDFRARWMHHPYFGIQALDAWNLNHVRSISGFQAILGFKYVAF